MFEEHNPDAIREYFISKNTDKSGLPIGGYLHIADNTPPMNRELANAIYRYESEGGSIGATSLEAAVLTFILEQ